MAFPNAPRVLRGAFVEYGLSLPPLFVVFQFNPVELSRSRNLSFGSPDQAMYTPPVTDAAGQAVPRAIPFQNALRAWHQGKSDLMEIRNQQQVRVEEETLSFDIRLDASDKLEAGDPIATRFGVLPQLSTLEMMMQPKSEGVLGQALSALSPAGSYSFTGSPNPPLVLFIWGRRRVLPVNINSLSIRETEFSTVLDPVRATVSVSLTVIEGKNAAHTYSTVLKEAQAALNLAGVAELANVVIPG
ncbi:MAG TPA: hypothetical protein VF746_29450 [Longimicrobium sp.]|jgi:hypothetical protein